MKNKPTNYDTKKAGTIIKWELDKENSLNPQKALAETFTLTAFFRSLVNYPYSEEMINYLLTQSWLKKEELQARWDGFDKVFWEKYWKKISALSFSTIIEARWLLLDSILKSKVNKNTVILEIASWFSPRAINLINNEWFNASQYIETDKSETIWLKQWFYNNLSWIKTPILSNFNVITDNISNLEELLLNIKQLNPNINKLIVINEWLLIYLLPEEQRKYFDNIKKLQAQLKKYWIDIEYISIDLPTHENFTNWLLEEWFTHEDHINVMRNVDSKILECLHNWEQDFFENIWILWENIEKCYYTDDIITKLETWKLDKYKDISWIRNKVNEFLKQKILFAYSINLSSII